MHTIRKTTAAVAVSAAALVATAGPSGAGPLETGCDLFTDDDSPAKR